MKMTDDFRKYGAEQGVSDERGLDVGMKEKVKGFLRKGAALYAKS